MPSISHSYVGNISLLEYYPDRNVQGKEKRQLYMIVPFIVVNADQLCNLIVNLFCHDPTLV